MSEINLDNFIVSKDEVVKLTVNDSDVLSHLEIVYGAKLEAVSFYILRNPSLAYYHRFLNLIWAEEKDWDAIEMAVYEMLVDAEGKPKIKAGDTLDRVLVDHIALAILKYLLKPQRSI